MILVLCPPSPPFFVINSCLHIHLYMHLYIPLHIYLYISLLCTPHSWASPFFSWTDESTDEETFGPKTKEEGNLETFRSWTEVSFYFLPFFWVSMWLSITFYSFLPLYFFHLLGAGFVEKGWCSLGRGPEIGDGSPVLGGLWFRKDGGGSGRLRGGRFLWAPEGSNVTFLHILSPTFP